jgi:peroxiredoxin
MPADRAYALINAPKAVICFFDFQGDASEQFLEVIALMSHEYMTSIKWIIVTTDNPTKLEASLKAKNAVAEVFYDKQGRLLDDFGVLEVPTIILTDEDQIVYKHGKYSPGHNERLAEVVSSFAQGRKIPESYPARVLKVGDYAPDITLPSVSGKTWSLSEALRFLGNNAHLLQDTEVIVVSLGPKKLTTSELRRMPIPFTVLCDEDSSTYAKYHLTDTPTLVLAKGDIITYVGTGWNIDREHEFLQAIARRK